MSAFRIKMDVFSVFKGRSIIKKKSKQTFKLKLNLNQFAIKSWQMMNRLVVSNRLNSFDVEKYLKKVQRFLF